MSVTVINFKTSEYLQKSFKNWISLDSSVGCLHNHTKCYIWVINCLQNHTCVEWLSYFSSVWICLCITVETLFCRSTNWEIYSLRPVLQINPIETPQCAGPQMYTVLKPVADSCRINFILLAEGSILDICYEIWKLLC